MRIVLLFCSILIRSIALGDASSITFPLCTRCPTFQSLPSAYLSHQIDPFLFRTSIASDGQSTITSILKLHCMAPFTPRTCQISI